MEGHSFKRVVKRRKFVEIKYTFYKEGKDVANIFDAVKDTPECLLHAKSFKLPTTHQEYEDMLEEMCKKYLCQPVGPNEIRGICNDLMIVRDMANKANVNIEDLFPITVKTGGCCKYLFHITGDIYESGYEPDSNTSYTVLWNDK